MATKKSVEASCRAMEAVAARADKALAALQGRARQLDDANLAEKGGDSIALRKIHPKSLRKSEGVL